MSVLRVNQITNSNDDGPVEFTKGVILPAGKIIDGELIINTVGVVTASAFFGDGSNITNIPGDGVPKGKALALTFIL